LNGLVSIVIKHALVTFEMMDYSAVKLNMPNGPGSPVVVGTLTSVLLAVLLLQIALDWDLVDSLTYPAPKQSSLATQLP
jgi:hypothetical protein